jgi:phospholipid N-methyltransferase
MRVRKTGAFLERCRSITEVIPSSSEVARGLRRKILLRMGLGVVVSGCAGE